MTWFARLAYFTALLLLPAFTFRLWHNLRFLNHTRASGRLPDKPPRVSILVPARNEARNITACIESLAAQDYPDVEIIALNDQSDDETGALLDALAARYPHVTALHGDQPPPAGWNGKSYACHRLAEHATGDWLLFTDADTVHATTSVAQGIAQAHTLGADLLSAFPHQITQTWSERVVVSFILDFLPLLAVDLADHRQTSRAMANGQYLLVRASTYRATGGHAAIWNALVDDFALARQLRAHGHAVALVDGMAMLACRMYRNAGEVWDGFSKNILLGLETSSGVRRPGWYALPFAWGYASLFVLPFWLLPFRRFRRQALVVIGWLGLLRAVVNLRFGRSLFEVATTPLAAWSVMAFGLSALARRRRKMGMRWKGREYSLDV